MEFIVSLFSNACTISLLFLKIVEILCTFHYTRVEFPILVRGHFKDTVERFDIEMLFIIIERYVKLYIFDCVEIVHDRAMAICVIALNRDVSSMTYCIEMISHSFSILSSVESASIPCTSSIRCYQYSPVFFGENSDCYALAYEATHMRSA